MEKLRIGLNLQHPRLRQWCAQLLGRDFELLDVDIQDPDVVDSVDMLLFDEVSAAEQQHWLDLFRRRLAPDSPPLVITTAGQPRSRRS